MTAPRSETSLPENPAFLPLMILEGVLLLLLAILAALGRVWVGLAITAIVGWIYLIAGCGRVAAAVARDGPGALWAGVGGVVAVLAGALLILNPWQGLVSLTLVLAAYLLVDGGASLALGLALRRRGHPAPWIGAAGALEVLLGLLVLATVRDAASGAIGLIVAVNLAVSGAALVLSALGWRAVRS